MKSAAGVRYQRVRAHAGACVSSALPVHRGLKAQRAAALGAGMHRLHASQGRHGGAGRNFSRLGNGGEMSAGKSYSDPKK